MTSRQSSRAPSTRSFIAIGWESKCRSAGSSRLSRPTLITSAATLDWLLGDPESLPHPVRLIGKAIAAGDHALYREDRTPTYNFLAGSALTFALVAATWKLTAVLIKHLPKPFEILLASTCLASRNLDDEARAVLTALELDDLPQARQRIARIVGRDTAHLDEPAIARALIETLAESAADGILAPLFFLAIGGVPAAMAFKAISTLDSMIGHRTKRYLHFGKTAARLDDLANLIPARLTALLILATNPSPAAISTYSQDHNKHASPNAGHPESAMAGTLGIQLGGPSTYDGEPHTAPILNASAPLPTRTYARRALHITRAVSLLGTALAIAIAYNTTRRRSPQ
ncbi:adenosylcobinamide-phosphate synthase CbiB [Granulicella tundricola]|uniref:Cobalamin biosynthesis protein CobD n=1 Tax=Granulicella tundricola (strain ATCC BAA-1859 / DSM 23138 / MP5ACTX9) TaxID=1198114 RepID=E8X1D5_GRATM|nr:adenosylcobinamide-phosphate synthase CbiB [Granulicella tundricola]ADW69089.1 cobalamin biosynthesis protein CobD [Granulicella tundricola MP5ACTX9]